MRTGVYRDYALMTKLAFNDLIGQKKLWISGEREALLQSLCTRTDQQGAPRVWITQDYFFQVAAQVASSKGVTRRRGVWPHEGSGARLRTRDVSSWRSPQNSTA